MQAHTHQQFGLSAAGNLDFSCPVSLNLNTEETALLICLLEQTSFDNVALQSPAAQQVRDMISTLESKLYALLATAQHSGSRPTPSLPASLHIIRS
jgi:hypothetical protein